MKDTFIAILLAVLGCACTTLDATAAPLGTPITLSTAIAFVGPPCSVTASDPCTDIGTFTANDETTANVICASGTVSETFFFTHGRGGPITIADRTWTCPDGSTLVMHILRWVFIPITATTADILETWVITGGTGGLSSLQGRGTAEEIYNFGVTPNTFGGTVTGFVH
jgi:hypothetical protein